MNTNRTLFIESLFLFIAFQIIRQSALIQRAISFTKEHRVVHSVNNLNLTQSIDVQICLFGDSTGLAFGLSNRNELT
jgi:hypothetical protein